MKKKRFSIIIPAYNVCQYIDKAIESLKFINEKYDYSKLPRKQI